jgi:WD40 repeat protein
MFKQSISKFKNATPKISKKEQILNNISTNRLSNTIGNLITCNTNFITFAVDNNSGRGSVCTITHESLNDKLAFTSSSEQNSLCVRQVHSGPLTDIEYSPFNNKILATCGFDSTINIWSLTNKDIQSNERVGFEKCLTLSFNEKRSDCIKWNPNVDNILLTSSMSNIYLWDLENTMAPVKSKFLKTYI